MTNLNKSKNPAIVACRKEARITANRLQRDFPRDKYKVKDDTWKFRERRVFAGCEILKASGRKWWGGYNWKSVTYLPVKDFR